MALQTTIKIRWEPGETIGSIDAVARRLQEAIDTGAEQIISVHYRTGLAPQKFEEAVADE